MHNEEKASKAACQAIRNAHSLLPEYADDNEIIEEYKDEWTWFMQGWKQTMDLYEEKRREKALEIIETISGWIEPIS